MATIQRWLASTTLIGLSLTGCAAVCLTGCAAVCLTGCATWRGMEPQVPDVRPIRKQRAADVVSSFEKGRDQAEFQAIRSYWQHGQREDALARLETLLKRNPAHIAGQTLLLEALLVSDKLDQAVAAADRVAEIDDARIYHARGLVYDAVDRHEDAIECLEQAIEREPNNATFVASLHGLRESAKLADEPEVPELLVEPPPGRSLSTVTPQKPIAKPIVAPVEIAPECVLLSTEICLGLGRPQDARRRLDRATAPPDLASAAQLLSRRVDAALVTQPAGVVQGRSHEAAPVVHLTEAIKPAAQAIPVTLLPSQATQPARSKPRNDDFMEQAQESLKRGHLETAHQYLLKARQAAPQDESVAVSTSVLPLRHEEWELAIDLANEALEQFSESAALYRIVGTAEYRLNRYAPAREALDRAIDLDKHDALAYFLMGCTLSKLGQNDEAQMYYRQAEELDARYARNHLAR